MRIENGRGRSSPGASSSFEKSTVVLSIARRRAGLEAAEVQAEGAKRVGERFRGRLAEAAADGLLLAGVHERAEERAGGDDDGAGVEARAVA